MNFLLCRQKMKSSLSPNAAYEDLVSVRLVGMMLTLFVRQELLKNIKYSTQTVGTGALNFMVSSLFSINDIYTEISEKSI